MALVSCPECKSEISTTSERCIKCGYLLQKTSETNPLALVLGFVLVFGGIYHAGQSYNMDTSVEVPSTEFLGHKIGGGRVVNLSLMEERRVGIIMGSVALAIGVGLFVFGQSKC